MNWLPEPTVDALREALRTVAPELADAAIVPRGLGPQDDPRWCGASAVVDGRYVVKFAWAEPPAQRICYQASFLEALRTAAPRLPLPEVVASSRDPALLITRRVRAVPFFAMRQLIGPADLPTVAHDLAAALAVLHDPGVLRTVTDAIGPLPARTEETTTDMLRAGFGERMLPWYDWADRVLATPGRTVLVHGDFHGDNHLWQDHRLRLVIDLETAGVGEPEYDLRCLPGDCGAELFTATVAHYEQLTGTTLDVDRILAWHLRTVLGDALWRTAAGVPLPGNHTPEQWVDDLLARLTGSWHGRNGRTA